MELVKKFNRDESWEFVIRLDGAGVREFCTHDLIEIRGSNPVSDLLGCLANFARRQEEKKEGSSDAH